MKKCIKTMVISLLLIIALPMAKLSAQVSTWDGTWEPWTHGTGAEADPFLIENAQQLAYLAHRVNKGLDAGGGHVSNHNLHYKLMIDVNLNGSNSFQWAPIGYWNSNADYQCFGGHFDGNDHVVSGLYINLNSNRVGFFGSTDGASIEALGINSQTIVAAAHVGGIIGVASNTTVAHCYNIGNVIDGYNTGGIVGYVSGGNLTITNCYNTGNVTTNGGSGGGIVGRMEGNDLIITNCYNIGNVINGYNTGGIVGYVCGGDFTITSCYNTGNVTTNGGSGGGIVGLGSGGNVTNCYYLNTCGGNNTYGGHPMSFETMKSIEFVETLNVGSCAWKYDYNNTNLGYPVLTMLFVDAVTSDVTHVTQTHATLHGTISTENASILSQGFEYKKTSDFNFQTVNVSGSGNISTTLSGLQPNAQYQYRTFCTPNDCGTNYYGEVKTFTTLPVCITTYSATDVTANSAVLNGFIEIGDASLASKGFEYREEGG